MSSSCRPGELPSAAVESVALPRRQYRPGETLEIDVGLRLSTGGRERRMIRLDLPADLPPGQYPLSVGDSVTALQSEAMARPFAFDATGVDEVFDVLRRVDAYPSEAIYARLSLPERAGVAVGRTALENLPASRGLLLAEGGRSEVTAFEPAITATQAVPFVVEDGSAEATISVVPGRSR